MYRRGCEYEYLFGRSFEQAELFTKKMWGRSENKVVRNDMLKCVQAERNGMKKNPISVWPRMFQRCFFCNSASVNRSRERKRKILFWSAFALKCGNKAKIGTLWNLVVLSKLTSYLCSPC